ncbi:uncharacterized protein BDW47DRAFT_128246 [Aspergillus candidus]|uniref:Uncharacterized protein n=1 Tax=Aspergillus candidus TaxID=41067 RepID=A0A2I2F3V0_ASPCN|nr:hypothetical protein BDW47DRAFT_128246 [Aspergillus candidus]PLB35314.1 hypothetical protein BDW47DRAFT_128246 [Aspergillus candidus]
MKTTLSLGFLLLTTGPLVSAAVEPQGNSVECWNRMCRTTCYPSSDYRHGIPSGLKVKNGEKQNWCYLKVGNWNEKGETKFCSRHRCTNLDPHNECLDKDDDPVLGGCGVNGS